MLRCSSCRGACTDLPEVAFAKPFFLIIPQSWLPGICPELAAHGLCCISSSGQQAKGGGDWLMSRLTIEPLDFGMVQDGVRLSNASATSNAPLGAAAPGYHPLHSGDMLHSWMTPTWADPSAPAPRYCVWQSSDYGAAGRILHCSWGPGSSYVSPAVQQLVCSAVARQLQVDSSLAKTVTN